MILRMLPRSMLPGGKKSKKKKKGKKVTGGKHEKAEMFPGLCQPDGDTRHLLDDDGDQRKRSKRDRSRSPSPRGGKRHGGSGAGGRREEGKSLPGNGRTSPPLSPPFQKPSLTLLHSQPTSNSVLSTADKPEVYGIYDAEVDKIMDFGTTRRGPPFCPSPHTLSLWDNWWSREYDCIPPPARLLHEAQGLQGEV